MYDSSVAQPAYVAKDGGVLIQVTFDRVYDQDRLIIRSSRNDGDSYHTDVVIPLADAIEFAKALLGMVQPAARGEAEQMSADLDAIRSRQADEDEYIERMWEHEQARRSYLAGLDGDIADDHDWIRQGC